MKIHWSWLLELVDLKREVDAVEGAAILTRLGLEVEDIEDPAGAFSGVIVSEVKQKRKHPDADKLTIVTVDDGSGKTAEVVCGAPNVPEAGGWVLWAKPGAVLPGGMKIGKRAIKGFESPGMLCAEDELGLGDDHGGIIVLPKDAYSRSSKKKLPLGATAQEALDLSFVFDVGIPANRPDALGLVGVARELAMAAGGKVAWPNAEITSKSPATDKLDGLSVEVREEQACKRYMGRLISGVSSQPSPVWMQQRLRAVGVRPINSLVDVTNYVMFETGHPLHVFDKSKVSGKVVVRYASAKEKIVTLDGQNRELLESDLVIADEKRALAIAGVMGGLDSQVTDATTEVFLETAAFNPITVRRTAKRLGLHSESSYRFERFVDPAGVDFASKRASKLLVETSGGKLVDGYVDVYPTGKPSLAKVHIRTERASQITGVTMDSKTIESVLVGLEAEVSPWKKSADGGEVASVTCPSFRPDLTREEDLIEEVLRHHGYDKVPDTLPRGSFAPSKPADSRSQRIRKALTGNGFSEAITFGFCSKEKIERMQFGNSDPRSRPVSIRNPMSAEQGVLRTSLLPNLLEAVAFNQRHGEKDIALFEIGSVFLKGNEKAKEQVQVVEERRVSGVLAGSNADWLTKGDDVNFFDIKNAVVGLVHAVTRNQRLRFSDSQTEGSIAGYAHPGISAAVSLDDEKLGSVFEVHPNVRDKFGIADKCYAFDIAYEALPMSEILQMTAIAMYPSVSRDISFFVAKDVPAASIEKEIRDASTAEVESVSCLEDYRDPAHVPEGQKGMLWSITYRSQERTLTDKDVDTWHESAVSKFLKILDAKRR